ncbi:MAG: outer membrane beta-barrel family protein [Chryseobacterium sp.]|uniref:outer membrane beta-barrel protein n=1 Tax=Chryseobacterium sp. TaxID=1871047 RepID=UPI0025BCCF70|nr:outer membrane beta-barrel protein [Chryseobacterium sp.]MCJ7932951.1 outer membrane beta-barrel family protein [Chryseobacterium sp.]
MKNLLLLLILVCNILIAHAQKLHIDGKVYDLGKKPLENATIYLLKAKDSSIVNYTATNKEGKFSLKIDEVKEPSILTVDAEKMSYSKTFEKIDHSLSLGDIELEKKAVINIDEIHITVAPVKIKNDTIEFNASALKVRPDSKIEELLKQIPGVEIGNDGKITANGKEVDQIMVNGKPFFDKDGKIALQNLPADIIKNIQFTTTKSKEEELSGKSPKSQNTTINFNIDERKNKGFLSRITAGYGSDKRYEGSGLVSYFKGNTKISLLASSNNINSRSVSADDVFDNMGHSRNSGMQNTGSGVQKTTTFGLNYSDKLGNDTDLDNLSLKYSNSDMETRSKVSRTTLLPDYTLKTNSENKGENESREYSFDSSARIKLDSLTNIYISPSFSRSKNFSSGRSASSTLKDEKLLNESASFSNTRGESNTFTPNIYFSKNLRKKGRLISAMINSTISESKSDLIHQSQNSFYQNSGVTTDNRDQLQRNRSQGNNYNFRAGYTEPISDSASVSFEIQYNSKLSRDLRDFSDFDPATGQYSKYNSLLSNSMDQRVNQFSPELSFFLNKKKFNTWSTFNIDISDMKVNSVFKGQQYQLQKNFVLPRYSVNFQYVFSERNRLTLSNSSSFNIPGAEQLIPYKDESDPLVTYTGNPDLKNTWVTSTNASFSSFNIIKNFNYYINAGFTYRNNDVINYTQYDSSGKQIVTYDNISGNKNINLSTGLSKTFKWKDNKLTVSPRFSMNYTYNNGFINGQPFKSNSYNFNPGLNLNYEIRDKITIKPSYRIGYNFSKYSNYSIDQVNTSNQSLKLELTNYLFQSRLVFGNDFEYNTSSNIAPGFKKDFYFWNTSLGYSFFKKQLTAKVKIYDVFNQNQSVRRTITDSYFEDREDLILKRYIMFSLSMKLNKFSGKKNE